MGRIFCVPRRKISSLGRMSWDDGSDSFGLPSTAYEVSHAHIRYFGVHPCGFWGCGRVPDRFSADFLATCCGFKKCPKMHLDKPITLQHIKQTAVLETGIHTQGNAPPPHTVLVSPLAPWPQSWTRRRGCGWWMASPGGSGQPVHGGRLPR